MKGINLYSIYICTNIEVNSKAMTNCLFAIGLETKLNICAISLSFVFSLYYYIISTSGTFPASLGSFSKRILQ